jgi:hypothetical protein
MAAEKPTRPESEEQSIKARKHEMFEEEQRSAEPSGPKKPAQVYLRSTPAAPLSTGVKAILWVVGAIVLLLLVAAVFTRGRSGKGRPAKTGVVLKLNRALVLKSNGRAGRLDVRCVEAAGSAGRECGCLKTAQVPNSGRRAES